jgi:hypothetical protein
LDIGIFLVVALRTGPFGGSRSIAEGSGAGRFGLVAAASI